MSDIKLGGRMFSVVNMARRTVEHDDYQVTLVKDLGLYKSELPEATTAAYDAWLLQQHAQLVYSGRKCDFIAAFLLPLGKSESDWSPETSAEIAAHLKKCDTQEDRERVNELGMELLHGFFRNALHLYEISQSYIRQAEQRLNNDTVAH